MIVMSRSICCGINWNQEHRNWTVANNSWTDTNNWNDQSHHLRQKAYNAEIVSAKQNIPLNGNNASGNSVFHQCNASGSSFSGLNKDMASASMISFLPKSAESNDERHFSHMAVGVKSCQSGSNPDIVKSQPTSQPLNFENGSFTCLKSNQATSVDVDILEQHHPSTHTVGQSPNQMRNSLEGVANMEVPVSYDFLVSQHRAIPRQQQMVDEMKLWQKHCSYQERLQELHRQQRDQLLNQYSRQQQQLEQLMSRQKQSLGEQISPSLNESYLHELSSFMHPRNPIQQMEVANHSLSLLAGNYQNFNVGSLNSVANGSPSMRSSSNELFVSQDPSLAWQLLAFNGARLDPSVNGSLISSIKDPALQPSDLNPSLQGMMPEISGALNNGLVTSGQVQQPIACDPVIGASVMGNHQAQHFDPLSGQNDASYVGRQAPSEPWCGQSLHQSFPQTAETGSLLSNLQQGNAVSRNLQYREFIEKQQEQRLTGDVGQKNNIKFGLLPELVNSHSLLETVFCDPLQPGCDKFDSRTQSISAGQHAPQDGNQEGSIQFLNNLESKQHGSWSALMQSAVAEVSSTDTRQQDCQSRLLVQKNLSVSGDSLQMLSNDKRQNSWEEQSIPLPTSFMGSFYLASHAGSRVGAHSVESLPQTNFKSVGQLCSRLEGTPHNNQSNLQSRASSQSLCEASMQVSRWNNQSLHQVSLGGGSNLKSYAGFEDMPINFWKSINTEQVPSERIMPFPYMNFDGKKHNDSWFCDQGYSETKSFHRMPNLTLNEQSNQNDNEASGTDQNSVWLNAHQRCQDDNEDATCSRNENLDNLVSNIDELSHNRSKDTFTSCHLQVECDGEMKACQDEESLQQETTCLGISPLDSNTDNLQNNLERHGQILECNSQLFGSNLAMVQNSSEEHLQIPENNCQLAGTMHASWDSMAKSEGIESTSIHKQSNNSHVWDSFLNKSSGSGHSSEDDLSRAQCSHDGFMVVDEIQKASKQIDFEQSINSSMNTGTDAANTWSQIKLKKRPERVFLKGASSGHAPAQDQCLKDSCLNKITCISRTSENLSKAVQSNESSSLKGMACTVQDVSADQCRSLAPDVSPSHFCQIQTLNPLSYQGFSLQILEHGQPLLLNSCSSVTQGLDVKQTSSANENQDQVHAASAVCQDSSAKVSNFNKIAGLNLSPPVASPAQLSSSPCELSFTGLQERVVADSDMCALKAQVYDLHNISAKQQVTPIPQAVAPHAVNQRQFDIQGIFIPCTDKLQGSPGVTSWMVNSLTASVPQKESEMQSTFSAASKPSSKICSPAKVSTKDGSGLNHKGMTELHGLANERDWDPSLQESQASSISHPLVISGISQSACFSKLLSNLKNLANQQRRSMGPEKTFPGVFESFRPLFGRLENYAYSVPPKSGGHMSSGSLNTTEKLMASMCTNFYSPCMINSQERVSAKELTMQQPSLQQKASDKGEPNGMPVSSSSSKDVSMKIASLPSQMLVTIPQVELQGQAHELISIPKIHSSVSTAVASPIHSVVLSHDQIRTKVVMGQSPPIIPGSACPSSQHKNNFTTAGSVLREDSELYALSQQYPLLGWPMPVPMEQNNEDEKTAKALDAADANFGSGLSLGVKSNQQAAYPHNWLGQQRIVAASSMASSPEDARMGLSFPSSDGNKDYKVINDGCSESSTRVNGMCQINPQLADFGGLRLGSSTNEKLLALQVAAMYQRMASSGRPSVLTSKQFLPGKHIDCLFPGAGLVPQFTGHITEEVLKDPEPRLSVEIAALSPTEDNSIYRHSLSKSNIGPPVAVLPKKRKKVILPLIPWHIEISEAEDQLPTMSDVELAWAAGTDRLPEKDEDDVQFHDEEAGSISRAKRRLKLATQLMQHLIPPLPTAVMFGRAIVEHESATYVLAKTALGDACKLGSGIRAFGQLQKFKRLKDNSVLRMVESFGGRANDLKSKLLGLETSAYMSDLRSEYHDLERLSITNRLAKHHARSSFVGLDEGIAEGTESSSDSAFSIRRLYPHRYVTAVPMPKNLPEGVPCYSL